MLRIEQIRAADSHRGEGRFSNTPLHFPTSLNRRISTGDRVHLKLELLQRTGSFKVRGATAKILALGDKECSRGIVAASAGNHAQAVALAATARGTRSWIVMPVYAPLTKRDATKSYGAEVILHGSTYDEAYAHALKIQEEHGGVFVHAFDDEQVMAGQGTIGIEVLDQLPDLKAVVCPVGGGGLISGVAVAIKSLKPEVKVIGVQAEGAANAVQSFLEGRRTEAGAVNTIADGIKVQQVGERCFDVIQKYVDERITVSDVEIARAMLLLDEHAHLSAEPAGAVPVAAFLSGKLPAFGGPAMAVISGGNIDTFEKTRYIRRALAEEERHLRINVRLVDRRGSKPRQMSQLYHVLAQHEINILHSSYRRDIPDLPLGIVEVGLLLETLGADHARLLKDALRQSGFELA
ncbi:MAG: threonine ammonia-lyase [Planctomycetota bacterium]|jgi:threonine dehydratase